MAPADEHLCNPISRAELERRWSASRAAMQDARLDALIVQGANNLSGGGGYFRWLTGLSVWTSYPQTVILPRDGLTTLVCHGPFDGDTKHDGGDPALPGIGRRLTTSSFPAVAYTSGYDADLVARAVKEGHHRRIGLLSPATMYHGFAARLRQALPGLDFADATELIDPIKARKSEEEIALIRRAAAMQDEILRRSREHIRPGLRDCEVFAHATYLGQTMGSENGYFLGSSAPRGRPAMIRLRPQQGREIRDGDVILWQAENAGPGGYYVHLARPVTLGKAPQELIDAFGRAVEAQDFTLGLLKAGASCRDVFAEYNAYMRGRNLPPERRLHCHGQGTDVVERPLIRDDEAMTLAPGMNIGVHPSFATERLFMTICDNFLLGAGGAERLHKTPRAIVEL